MNEYAKVLIPMIRKVLPAMVAKDILGVQPMGDAGDNLFTKYFGDKEYNKKYWPYQYTVKRGDVSEAERWCWERFKGRTWNNTYQKFVFKRSIDATMFALRWCS